MLIGEKSKYLMLINISMIVTIFMMLKHSFKTIIHYWKHSHTV